MAAKIHYYPAVIEAGEPGSNLGVFFPDLPGCVSFGDDVIDCVRHAEEALSLHLSGMLADGDRLPEPSPLDKLHVPRGVNEVARQFIRAEVSNRTLRLNISLDEALVLQADRHAAAQGYTRSGYIASLIRDDGAKTAKPKRRRAG